MLKYILGYSFLLATVAFVPGASAQKITPSHVLQVVDNVNGELALLHDANDSKRKTDSNAPALTKRRPRHVIQKGREVFLKIQQLRKLNGLTENPVPTFPVREIRPADVKNIVDAVLVGARGLRTKYGITKPSPNAPLPSGKSPTDVYAGLIKAGHQLDGLEIPRVVPNFVQQVALTVVDELALIRAARGLEARLPMQTGAKGKKPSDAWNLSYDLLVILKNLTDSDPDFKVPGGIVLTNKRAGKISPAAVIDVLNNVLAELSAIKVTVGAKTPTKLAPMPSGMTPSNVYDAVGTAIDMVKGLSAKNS